MKVLEIPRKEWSGRLDEFSRMHEGWLVSLDIASGSAAAMREFRQMPLVGITSESRDGGTITISVAEPAGDQTTHTIHSPSKVLLARTDEGANAALEIESADGTKAILRFRTTTRPEMVDGVLHG